MPQKPSSTPTQFIQGAPVLPVRSVDLSVDFFEQNLGFQCDFRSPEYAVVWRDNAAFHFTRSNGAQAQAPVRIFNWLVDVDAYYKELEQRGTAITQEIGDRNYGIRDFSVTDVNGFILIFGQDIY